MGAAPLGARFVTGPLEPGLARYVELPTPEPEEGLPDGLSWADYRKCPTCAAETGAACVALYSKIIEGQPGGDRALLPRAHGHRQRRAGR